MDAAIQSEISLLAAAKTWKERGFAITFVRGVLEGEIFAEHMGHHAAVAPDCVRGRWGIREMAACSQRFLFDPWCGDIGRPQQVVLKLASSSQ
jgi:hypothetical protein